MNFFRRRHNGNNNDILAAISSATQNNNANENNEEIQKIKPKKRQIAEYTNIRDIPLHRVQFVEYRGGDSIFLLRISIGFAIITIIAYIILSYIVDLEVKEYESKWKKIFTNIFISYSSGVSFIFITWGVAFYFVSHVISQRIDAELLHNEYNMDGNKILYIRGSIPDFYHYKKELTKGCNIKLIKTPFLFNNKATKYLYSSKIEDYDIYTSQFRTNSYYRYQNISPSTDDIELKDELENQHVREKSFNTIQRAISNSSKLEKILIATPINLSS